MATFTYSSSSDRMTGHQGRLNSLSLTGNNLTGTEASGSDAFNTSATLFTIQRVFALYNSSNALKGIGWITLSNSLTDYNMKAVLDANGNTCYFINHKGEAQTVTSTDYVLLSGLFSDLTEPSDDLWDISGDGSIALKGQVNFGTSTANEAGVVFYTEASQISGTTLTSKDTSYLNVGGGVIVCGQLDDYSTNRVSRPVDFNVTGDVGRRFRFGAGSNPSTGYTGHVYWFGGYFGSNSQDFDNSVDSVLSAAWPSRNVTSDNQFKSSIFMSITTKSPPASGDVGQPPVADNNGNGGVDDHILRGSTVNYIGGNFAAWQYYGTSANNTILIGPGMGDGGNVRGAITGYFSAANDTHFPVGGPGTNYTIFDGRELSGANRDTARYWRVRHENRNWAHTGTNIACPTFLMRDNSGANHTGGTYIRRDAGGTWFNLDEDSKIYRTYEFTPTTAQQNAGEWDDDNWSSTLDVITVPDTGVANVVMRVQSVDIGSGSISNSNVTTDTTHGYIKYSDDATNGTYEIGDGEFKYSIKKYGYEDISVVPTRQSLPVAGYDLQLHAVAPDVMNSLGGGRTGGLVQTQLAELWNGDSLRVSVTEAATAKGNLDTFTFDTDSGRMTAVRLDGSTDLNLTEFLAAIHHETAVPASDANGRLHRIEGYTVDSSGIIVFDEDFSLTQSTGNTTQISMDSANSSLSGIEVQKVDLDLGMFDGDDLTIKVSGSNPTVDADTSWSHGDETISLSGASFGTDELSLYSDRTATPSDADGGTYATAGAAWSTIQEIIFSGSIDNSSGNNIHDADNNTGQVVACIIYVDADNWAILNAEVVAIEAEDGIYSWNVTSVHDSVGVIPADDTAFALRFEDSLADVTSHVNYDEATSVFTNLPTSIPAWTLDGEFDYTSNDDATYEFDSGYDGSNFTFNNEGTGTVTLVGAGDDITTNNNSTGSIVLRKDVSLTITADETFVENDLKIRFGSADGSNPSSFATATDAEVTVSGSTATATFRVDVDHDTFSIAIWYEQYEMAAQVNVTSLSDVTLTKIATDNLPNTTTSFAISGGSDMADITITPPTSDTGTFTVNLDDTGGASPNETFVKDWMHKIVTKDDDWMDSVAQGYISPTYVTYNLGSSGMSIPDTSAAIRVTFQHNTDTSGVYEFGCLLDSSTDGGDLWNLVSTNDQSTRLVFEKQSNGVSGPALEAILDRRLVTTDNMGNLGLGVPVKGADGNLVTTPDV